MDIGIEREEAMKEFTKQGDIPLPGETFAVEGDLNVHSAQQKAFFETLNEMVLNINNRLKTTAIHFALRPVIERQRAAQDLRVIHHRQKV